MLAKAQKWGNSLAVRIPKNVAKECGIEADTPVEILGENNLITIRPVRAKMSLDALLADITEENRHSEITTGTPVGKELW